MSLLEATDISVAYRGMRAVDGVSITVAQGEIASVVGPNGAGKSSLLAALMGLVPSGGRVMFDGEDISRLAPEERVARGVALVPETRDLFPSMSVRENLLLGAYRHRREGTARSRSEMEAMFTLFPRLEQRLSQNAGTLSGGERQMLAMARALMGRPRLLMLDEPSLGLAPLIVRDIFAITARLRDQGVAVLLVEQNARAALALSRHAAVLENGRVTLAGESAMLAADPRVTELYLGATGTAAPAPPSPP
jgi:branched-chain amino acid transport system ATP-binding protein